MMKHYFNTNKVLSVTALAIGAITIFFACKKDDKAGADDKRDNQTITAAQQETEINAIYEDAFTIALDYNVTESDLNGGNRKAPGTPSVLGRCQGVDFSLVPADLTTFPKVITLDFGEGCTDESGRTRKGKIFIKIDTFFVRQDANAIITFENYYVNGIKVEGVQKLKNLSSANGYGYSYTVVEGKLTYPTGKVVTYNGTRNVVQKEGANTPWVIADDIYEITGNASMKDSAVTATVNIKSGLIRKIACAYVSKGIVTLTVNAFVATLDYGNGDCDNKAVLTVGDKTKEIILSK